MDTDTLTLATLLLPFAAALLAPALTRALGAATCWALALVPVWSFVHFAGFLGTVSGGSVVSGGFDWVPSLGVRLSWYLDGLSLAFALLISGIGALIVVYSGGYLKGHPGLGRFLGFLLAFMGAMQGLVVADDFLSLFVFWELTSIASFLLIGFDTARQAARRAALQALLVTGMGGLALLAGLMVMAVATGTTGLSGLLASGDAMRGSGLYLAALLLVAGAAFTKSAQVPFHFWLPNAMEAPTPVSAYLHSATMVKAGVYLLMRLNPVLGGTVEWQALLVPFGAATLLTGAVLALRQTDLKLMLAYTTVASLGLLVMLTGIGTETAIAAAALYLLAHSLFKGALFMVAGLIDHGAGTRDVGRLGGLRRAMPLSFAAGLLAALSMAGIPLFFGFMAKEEIYAALGSGPTAIALLAVAVLGNALMAAVALCVGLKPFVGAKPDALDHPHEGSAALCLGPLVLAVLGLAAGLFSGLAHALLTSPMASAVAGRPVAVTIAAYPHLNLPFALSVATLALGLLLYWRQDALRRALAGALQAIGWGPDRGFDQALRALIGSAVRLTALVQGGRLEAYVTVTFAVIAASLLAPMVLNGELPDMPAMPSFLAHEWVVMAVALAGLAAIVHAKDRLTAIVSLGVQGVAVALLFLLFGAPDLSFTQFMIEILSVVILALVMTRLRLSPQDHREGAQKIADAAIAAACGLGFALLLVKVTQLPFDATLSRFYEAHSLAVAHGRNVVNVIIVDFRGFDTLGEIAVVMTAGLAILALVRFSRKERG